MSMGEMCRMMMIFMFVQNVIHFFFKGNTSSTPTLDPSKSNTSVSIGGRIISESHLQNYLRPGDEFNIDVYINYQNNWRFFKMGGISGKEPVWTEKRIFYNYDQENERHINLTLPVTEKLLQNNTLNLHMQVSFKNPFYVGKGEDNFLNRQESTEIVTARGILDTPEYLTFNQTISLIKYMPKVKKDVKRNLLSDDIPMPEPKKEEVEKDDGKYHQYFKKELYLYVINDPTTYGLGEQVNAPPP
jgi:Cleft lip and palate transmembrane protein 1 (CLPTM1)